ncbi:MAG: hypothetical protein H6828_08800 [Planctomycetes bacterium]|nr:hypothetical protein [Planctomycetota bacterium]
MAANFLEQLVSEWFEYQGYFVRRNVHVGKRAKGGYECELDVVAFHPGKPHLVHIEPSMDADSWKTRDERYRKKFRAGRRHIPGLFPHLDIPEHVDQIALFVYGSDKNHTTVGGGKVLTIRRFLREVVGSLCQRGLATEAVPEHMPILRALQFASEYRRDVMEAWQDSAQGKQVSSSAPTSS